jgi:hypothetical protein
VFVDGKRPSYELITASLEEAGAPPVEEAHHATKPPAKSPKTAKTAVKPRTVKKKDECPQQGKSESTDCQITPMRQGFPDL